MLCCVCAGIARDLGHSPEKRAAISPYTVSSQSTNIVPVFFQVSLSLGILSEIPGSPMLYIHLPEINLKNTLLL